MHSAKHGCSFLFMQHSWSMCHHNVRCHCAVDLQECSHMASGSLQVLFYRKHFVWVLSFAYKPPAVNVRIIFLLWTSGCVRTSPLFYAATRLTSRIGRSKQSRSHSIERRISSTMRFLQRATTTLRSPSSILLERLLGNIQHTVFICWYHFCWPFFVFQFLYICVLNMCTWIFCLAAILIFTLLSLLLLLLQKFRLTWLHNNCECIFQNMF